MRNQQLLAMSGLSPTVIDTVVRALACDPRPRGRPWSSSLRRRTIIACAHLRTNLTMRELAVVFGVSKSHVHRIIANLTPRLASLLSTATSRDRRRRWIVDGTLVPTRDHRYAAKSKNYRWSCNLQVLAQGNDLQVIAIDGGGPGNRNDTIHYRPSAIARLCQWHGRVLADGGYRGVRELVTPRFRGRRILRDRAWRSHRRRRARIEHAIGRLKNWRILRDYRRRGSTLLATASAIAFLHNLKFRDTP